MYNGNIVKIGTTIAPAIFVVIYPIVLLFCIIKKFLDIFLNITEYKNISGEIAVVTGGGHGLGKSIAIELARKGCHIAVVDINIIEAEKIAKFINATYNVKAKAYKVDVSNYEQVAELNRSVTKDLGTTTIVINNAAMLLLTDHTAPDHNEVQNMINVNLTAHFWTKLVFLPKMKELNKGHIAAISSTAGLIPFIYNSEYTSTKFGVRGLMRALRQELKLNGFNNINTTTVYPFMMETNERVAYAVRSSGFSDYFSFILSTDAAQHIVNGIQRNKEEIFMPYFTSILYRMIELLPIEYFDWLTLKTVSKIIDKSKTTFLEKHK